MSRKFIVSFLFTLALTASASISAFAQFAPVNGTVELQKADGTKAPVAGALVEVYRTDMKTGYPSSKTGKNGTFAFAGLTLGGEFILSVSAPGCAPLVFPRVKAGQEKLLITLSPGDGSKFTEAQARSGATYSGKSGDASPAELTPEQKQQQAEHDAQVKAITEKNDKAQKANEIVAASAKAASEAFDAKNYDLAIAKYEEGIAADPDFVGSAPVLNNNRAMALRLRGVDTRNKAVKETDTTAKAAGLGKTKKDLAESAAGYLRAWTILTKAGPTEIVDKNNYDMAKTNALNGAQETIRMVVLTEQVDPSVIEAAKVLTPAYVSASADPAKKLAADLLLADLYRVAGERESAIAAYETVLATAPDNVDALAGAGLVLVDLSWLRDNDKALGQRGANYLLKFVSLAPDTHTLKEGAKQYLDILKTQSIVPVKTTTPAKKKS